MLRNCGPGPGIRGDSTAWNVPEEKCQKRRGREPVFSSHFFLFFSKCTQQEKYDTYCAQVTRAPLLFHRFVVAKLQRCNVYTLQLSACQDLLQSVTFIHSLARSPLVFAQCLAVSFKLHSPCESKDARDPKPQNVLLLLPYWDGSPPLGSARLLESSAFKRRTRDHW